MISKEKKIAKVLEAIDQRGLTAYELSKNTGLNESGLNRFIKKEITNPHKATITVLHDYLYGKSIVNQEVQEIPKIDAPKEVKSDLENRMSSLEDKMESMRERMKMMYDQLLFFQNSWLAEKSANKVEKDKLG